MPNLEALWFDIVPLWAVKDNNGGCRNIGLEYLPSLREVRGIINCYGMSDVEADAALDTLWNECKVHPNHPTLNMNRWPWHKPEDSDVSIEDGDEKQQEEADEASQTADADVGKLSLASP